MLDRITRHWSWSRTRPGDKVCGLFRMHEPEVASQPERVPQLRLFRDWNTQRHKQRRGCLNELTRRGASLRQKILWITTGDSGNIPQYKENYPDE